MSNTSKYHIRLSEEQRQELLGIINKGKSTAKEIKHAQILLHADEGSPQGNYNNKQISEVFLISTKQIIRIKKRFAEAGLEAALQRKTHSRYRPRIIDGEVEAKLIALACSKPPQGRSSWSLYLLADRMVQLHIVDHISPSGIRKALKKMNLSLG